MKELKKPQLNIENASKLYDKLIDNGYDTDYLGDKDYFLEVMKKPSVRDELYNTIVERDDFKIGGREYYDSRLLAPTSSTIDDAPDDVQRSLATPKPASKPASETASKPQTAQQPQAGGTPFNPQGKGAVINNMLAKSREVVSGMQDAADKTRRMVENAPTNPQGQQLAKAHEMQRQMNGQSKPMGLSNWGAKQSQGGKQNEPQPKSMQSPQPYGTVMENGERKLQWLLGDGTITTNYLIADAAETQARGARLQHEFTRRMQGNGLDPAKKEDIKRQQELDMRDELKLQLDRQAEANKDARLQNAKEKNDAYTKWKKEHPFLSAVLSIINDGDVGNVNDALTIDGQQNIIDTENALDTEADFINQTQQKFDVAGNGGGTSLLKGLRNPWLREGTYSFGASDLRNAMALSKAQQKQERGEELSDAEQRLMTTAGISAAADELLDKDISAWYSVGSITSESIPFMAEMLANPLSGAGKAVAKYAVKRMGVEAVKNLTRKQLMTKIAARTLGDVAGAAGMAATTGTLGVLADAERRRMGDVVPEYDQSGRVIGAKFEGGEGYGTALAKSFGARTIENWSEMVGEYFSPMLNAAGKGVSKGLQKIGFGNVVDWATNVSNSAIARQIGNFESRVKFNGTIGEWAEEQVGTAANALLIGDSDWSDLVDARQQAITFGGVALMGGTISAIKAGVYPFGRRRAKNKLNEANEKGAEVYGERWNDIVTQFDEGKFEDVFPEQMRQAITPEEKESIIDYGRRLQTWRGYNIVDEKRRIEKIEAVEDDMRDNFDKGADTDINDNDTLNQIKLDYDSKVEAFTQAFGDAPENVLADDGDYTGQLIRMKNAGQLTEEQATAAIDYLNAKAKYDGATYSFEEGIDAVARKVRLDMQSTANKNGRVIAATTKVGGNEVYVIGGDVVADAEGNIDYTNSSTDIVIKHKDTGDIEYSNINNLSTATDMGDMQQLSDIALDNATAEYNRKRELFQSGKVDTTPGAKVSLRLNDGTEYSGTIAGRTEKTGNVIVRYEDGNLDSFSEEELQNAFDRYNWLRVSQQDTVDAAIRYALQQDAQQQTQPEQPQDEQPQDEQPKRFSVGSNVRVVGANGGEYSGVITEEDADGYTIELQDEEGNTISIVRKTANELAAMQPQEQQPIDETQQPPVAENPMQPIDAPETEQPQQPTNEQQPEQPSALAKVPVGDDGAQKFEEADPETAYDAIGEMMGNEDDRDDLIKQTIANLTKQIDKASKKVNEIQLKGNDYNRFRAEKAAARQQLESLQQQLEKWNAIAGIGQQRAEAAAAEIKRQEEERKAAEEAAKQQALREAEQRAAQARLKAQQDAEQVGGVPEMALDKPQDARARGFRNVNGEKVYRQEPLQVKQGKEVNVMFSTNPGDTPKGRVVVIESEKLQPSHIEKQRNPLHFIDEAQPKERTDKASMQGAMQIASGIRPEVITTTGTAYTGTPTVNTRGEVIQGNNRSAALKMMYDEYQQQADKYKQYLIDHAEEFGLTKEDIMAMQHPVLVTMLDVNDEEAIRLGQFVAQDTESGGQERIKADNTIKKLGEKVRSFFNVLLKSTDDEMSIAQLIDTNGITALKWLRDNKIITDTQYTSALDSKGNLNAESKNDLRNILYKAIFEGGSTRLEEMFNNLPAKAQKAILATAYRDFDSPATERIVPELQNSIEVFTLMLSDKGFAAAKNSNEARRAMNVWAAQTTFGPNGEIFVPSRKYSNFALELAVRFKGDSQNALQGLFNELYDLIQGAKEDNLFETSDKTPKTLEQAIKQTLNIDYNGQNERNALVGNNQESEERRQGTAATPDGGEQAPQGEGTTDGGGGATENGTGRGVGERIASAEADVNTEPTDKQKEAGNYKKGHVKIGPFDVTIENPKGSVRSGVDSDGERWSTTMNNTYGYIRGAIGVDGDHIDVYLSNDIDNWNGEKVFVIDVYNPDGSFDEHKVMLGFNEAATAREDFLKNYSEGWGNNRRLDVSEVALADFEKWVDSSKRKIKPFAEYKSVKSVSDNETQTEQPQQSRETEPQEQPTTETTEQPQQQTEQPKSDEKTAEEKPNEETTEKEFELTLEDIDAIDDPEVDESTKDSARDYINGKRNGWTQLAYEIIKNYVRNSVNLVGRNRRNADETQLAPASTETEREEIRDNGEPSGSMGGEQGTGTVSKPRQSGKNGKRNTRTATGEGSNTDVAGTEPVEGTTPVRSTGRVRRNGGGSTGSDVRQQRGEGSSDGDVRDDNKRKTDTARVDNEGLSESEIDGEIENILGQMKDILKNPAMTEKGRLNDITTIVAGLGVNAIKFMGLTAKLGGMFILKGVYRFDKWYSNMHKNLSPILQSGSTLTDEQIAEYLRSAWHMPFTYKGQRKEICEWAGELEAEELSKLAKMSIEEKRKLQKAAEDKKVVLEDLDNIRETLPFLLPAQHEDVLKAEKQFFNESHNDREHGHGKGFLFTNGTGTGKTYTGLGIAKRFLKQGKGRILIVTVNDTKINDWIKDAKNLGIEATQLADTKSKGSGVVVTQFANMRQNFALLEDEFDLVIYDESHKLIENQTGDETTASAMHYMLTCRDAESVIRREVATSEMGKEYRAKMGELANLEDLFEKSNQGNDPKAIAKLRELGIKSFDDFNARANQLREEIESIQRNIDNEVENRLRDENTKKAAEEASKKTKVVFLSASPFNTPSNLAYAESYIFSYPDAEEGTTRRAKKNAFLRDKFRSSYRINGNGDMVRTPDAQILDHERAEEEEIQFSDHMQNELNTMSGRVLDSAYDYSRSFPKLDMPEAKMINNAIQWLMQNQMKNYFEELFDYNRSTALWEIFKTKFIIDRIREHIKLGRRVVVFHRRKEIQRPINEPFRQGIARVMQSGSEVEKARIRQFAQQFVQLLMWEQQVDYTFPSEKLLQEFATPEEKARFKEEHDAWEEAVSAAVLAGKRPPREPKLKSKKIGIFNGDETKGDKDKAVSEFNNPNSEQDVIAIQIQSGKEGISLHDTDGKHQRVMISLALPQSPIEFVQAEGRIYRVGNKSDAIFEYPLLGINRELYDFAMKINGRSQTTENLAMGSRARGLRNSIVRAVMSSTAMPVNEGQGKGGKMLDSRETQKATDFDHAITNWKNWRDDEKDLPYDQKSIPDPLGFKLVQWAGIERGETVLVGYAGNGSVARYVPNGARMIAVESDGEKLARLTSEVGGGGRKIVEGDFNVDEGEEREAFSIVNKADVVIIKTRSGKYGNGFIQNNRAIEDVVKAIRHTEDSGRVLAVVPSEDSYEVQKAIRSLDTSLCSTVTQIIKLPANVFGKETEVLVIDKNNDVDIRRQRRREGAELSEVGAAENNGTKDNAILQEETLLGMRNAECKVRIIDRAAKIVKRVKPLVSKLEKNKYIKKINNIKRVSITRRGFSVLFNRYIVRMHDSRSNWNGYDININSVLAGGASLIEQARNWKELRRVLSLSKEEFSSIMRAYTDGEAASTREALELLADIIKATLDKTDTQLNNLAEGRSENQLKDNMTIDEFIDAYKSLDSQDEEVDALAEKVFAAARNIKGLKFRLAPASAFDSHNALAHYKPSENVIELNNDFYSSLRITDAMKACCLVHETIHAVTCWAIGQYKHNNNVFGADSPLTQACKDIIDVFNQINNDSFRADLRMKSRLGDNEAYGLSNEYEMLAEMSNPVFRAALKAKKLWRQLINGVRRILQLDVIGNDEGAVDAYTVLNNALNTIMDNFDARSYSRYVAFPVKNEFSKKVEDNGGLFGLTQLSLFGGETNVEKNEKGAEVEQKANAAIESFAEVYNRYADEEDAIITGDSENPNNSVEAELIQAQNDFKVALTDFYKQSGNSEEDAARMAKDMLAQVRSEVEISRIYLNNAKSRGLNKLDQEEWAKEEQQKTEQPKQQKNTCETAGGEAISVESNGGLPKLKRGEFAVVERQFAIDKNFTFDGKAKIESVDDVAYIFRQLESYCVEHAFAMLIKDGKPTIVHLGMGTFSATQVNTGALRAAVDKFGADSIYFIHNHPSGTLKPSLQEQNLFNELQSMFKGKKVSVDAIIIDTTSGKYVQFSSDATVESNMPKYVDGAIEYPVHSFSKQVFNDVEVPQKVIRSSSDVAEVLSTLRLGKRNKLGFLLLNRAHQVVGNIFSNYGSYNKAKDIADEIVKYALHYGADSVVTYGNVGLDGVDKVKSEVSRLSNRSVTLLDGINVANGLSAVDTGVMESSVPYENNIVRYRTSSEIDRQYPNWLDGTTTDRGKHTTQVEGTRKTYNKLGNWIESKLGKNVSILDASSGMGYGTADLKKRGFDIEDVEPYQSEERKKNNPATYSSYGQLSKKYDVIISNAVLNVIPDDWRRNVLHDMAKRLKDGGTLFINTRKAGEEKNIKDKIELDSPREVLVKRNGRIASYQRFFTQTELMDWVKKELGDGFDVEIANEQNSGTKGLAAVVVHKVTANEQKARMAARVHEIADGLNTPVRIVQSEEEVAQLPTYRKRHAKGWFDTATGEVVIVVPNNENMADVENTVAHEIVAHKGLRKLVGDERFDSFLDDVYNNLDGKIKAVIDERVDAEMQRRAKEIAGSKGGITLAWAEAYDAVNAQKEAIRREVTEEYMAELAGRIAESGFEQMSKEEQTVWGKVKERVMKFLDSVMSGLGVKTRLTDKELSYILYRSWKNLRDNGTLLDEAEDVDMRRKTGFNEKQETNEPTDPNGGGGIRYRVGEMSAEEYEQKGIKSGIVKRARDIYENAVSKHKYKTIEAFQDSMRSLLEMYKAISGNPNLKEQDIASFENAYTAENEMSSKNKAEQHEFEVTLFRPLAAAIAKLTNGKKKAEIELNKYLIAKHGLERNEVLARRDAQRSAEEEFRAKKMLVERALKADPDNEELLDELKELGREQREYEEELYSQYRQNDYSGLTSLMLEHGEDKIDVPTAEQRAKEFVDGYETDRDTATLWECINNCTKSTLKRLHTGGLISTDVYERTSKMFEFYIPLRGYDETTSDEVYSYLNDMDNMRGSVMKSAKGRRSVADDPIATIAQMADAAIRQANRNEMKQKFLNFVQNNPSDAVSVNHLWLRKNEITNEWEPVFCNTLNPEDTPEEVAAKMEEFEERMKELASQKSEIYKKDKGNGKNGDNSVNIPYRVIGENINEHQVLVRRNGRTFVITINGNPRAAQALNGLTNPDVAQGGIYGAFEKSTSSVNRKLSAVYTTLNPNFMVSNFARDMVYANTMVAAKEPLAYAKTFSVNCAKFNPAYMGKLFYLWENGELDDKNYHHRLFKEFMRNGGETGFSQTKTKEQYKSDVKKLVKRETSIRRKAGHVLAIQNDIANRAMENTARFAAYVTSRTFGRDVQRSVYDAKEVSVNFNKKGSGAKMYGAVGNNAFDNAMALLSGAGRALFVFWNAGVQGMNNYAKVIGRNPIKGTAVTMLYTALGFVVPAMIAAAAGDGDDEDPNAYYNLPEHIRRQNICINAGDQWLTIPLPIELRAFYGLGELAYEAMSGQTDYDAGELSLAISQQMTQLLPIDFLEGGGENPLMAFVPSTAKPVVEVVQNKSWTGLPIARENIWNENDPNWKKVYKNVNDAFLETCKTLSNITGGDDVEAGWWNWNPAKAEYILKGYTGGITQIATQMMNSYMTLAGKKDFDWRNVPVATRFVKNGDERTAYRKIQNDYFDYIEEYNKTEHRLKGYQEQVKGGALEYAEKIDFLQNSPEYQRYAIISQYKPIIDRYNKAKKAANGEDTKKLLEAQEQAYIAECVNAIRRGDDMRIAMPQAEEEELDTKTLYNQIATYDDWNEDIQFRVRAGQAKQSGNKQAQSIINKATARISKLKKQLGKDNNEDVMNIIRTVRKNTLEQLGDIQETPIEIKK